MSKTQWYIGAPNGVVLCIDQAAGRTISGRLSHNYNREEIPFDNMEQLLFEMERFYDSINFPHPGTTSRTFQEGNGQPGNRGAGRTKIMSDEELLDRHGDLGTFIIRVQHRQNSSWQGRITWVEKEQTVSFRSVWEMVKLMAGALETVSDSEEGTEEAEWPLKTEM